MLIITTEMQHERVSSFTPWKLESEVMVHIENIALRHASPFDRKKTCPTAKNFIHFNQIKYVDICVRIYIQFTRIYVYMK